MRTCAGSNHHFEPRYDKSPSKPPAELRFSTMIGEDAFRQITYVGDICTMCGTWVHRPKDKSEAA